MPAESLRDAQFAGGRPDDAAHYALPPVRPPSPGLGTGEDPVLGTGVGRMETSAKYGSSGIGFCDASVLHGPVTCITIERTTLICWLEKSTSFHFSANSSLILNPVPTSNNTKVRSLGPS